MLENEDSIKIPEIPNTIEDLKKKILDNIHYIIIGIIIIVLLFLLYSYFNKNKYDNYIPDKYDNYISDKYDIYIDLCSSRFDREQIYEFDNLLTDEDCDQIINMARPKLTKSGVLNDSGFDDSRTSTNTFLPSNTAVTEKIDKLVYDILKIPIENYEELQVVNYKPGQQYKAHYDACDNEPICIKDTERMGSLRYATFLLYLNDDLEGGETEFPYKNMKVKPKKGKGVLFFNLNDDNTERRYNSFHGGTPPTSGEKWMCNKWIRLKPIKSNYME